MIKSYKYETSNESYTAVLFWGTVYYTIWGGSNFGVFGWNATCKVQTFEWKLFSWAVNSYAWENGTVCFSVILFQSKQNESLGSQLEFWVTGFTPVSMYTHFSSPSLLPRPPCDNKKEYVSIPCRAHGSREWAWNTTKYSKLLEHRQRRI